MEMRMRKGTFPVLMAAVVFGACEGRTGQGEEPIEVREWRAVEELRLGSPEGSGGALTRLGNLLALPDGGLLVLQPAEQEVRVYGADGALVRRLGGAGQGAGQFTLPGRVGWWGSAMDTLWISDLGRRGVTLFSLEGAFAGTLAMPFVEHDSVFTVNQPSAVLPDGTALALAGYSPRVPDWQDFPLLCYDLAGGRVESEVVRLDRSASVSILWQGEGVTTAVHPLPDAPIVAYAPDASRIVLVDRSVTGAGPLGRIGVVALSASGDTLWARSFDYEPQPIAEARLDSIYADRIASLQQVTRLLGSLSDADAESAFRASVELPRHQPPVQSVMVGTDGWIWLKLASSAAAPEHWWVLDAEGRQRANLTHERALDVRAVGAGVFWAAEVDGGGRPQLVRYRVGDTDG